MERLGATEEEKKIAVYISMIYDLGLVPIDKDISKRKKLTTAETRIVKGHPLITVNLLSDFEFSDEVKSAILHHHERYDGTGYPDGLKGEEIPFISRVLHVVDAFCAMTAERPYRPAKSRMDALEEIKKHVGSMYDPVVVEAFEGVLTPA
jgi:HD-GYP domain-containing protein (c-di-GMP phosphodiesterase class II)